MKRNRPMMIAIASVAIGVIPAAAISTDQPPTIGTETQLFVDDVLLAAKSGVVRRTHACRKLPQPVLVPEKPLRTVALATPASGVAAA